MKEKVRRDILFVVTSDVERGGKVIILVNTSHLMIKHLLTS